jgi:hypothetical protein
MKIGKNKKQNLKSHEKIYATKADKKCYNAI